MSGLEDREVVSALLGIFILVLDVVHDHLVGDRTRSGCEVPSCPEMLAPELLVQPRVLREDLPGRLALQVLGDLGYGDLRRHGDEDMDVVFRYVTADDLDLMGGADLAYELPYPKAKASLQHGLSVLRRPYKVVFEVVYGVGSFAV